MDQSREFDDLPRIALDSLLSPPSADGPDRIDLWSLLPPELAALFRPTVHQLADEILDELLRAIPVLARTTTGTTITVGIQQAVLRFIDRLADPGAPQEDGARLFRELGRQHQAHDPELDVLQMAYRVGAGVAWRQMSGICRESGVPMATMCLLAEALFAYIDELSALSVEGQNSARIRQAGSLERRRRKLLDLIASPRDTTATAISELAEAVRWPMPDRVIAVALEPHGEQPGIFPDSRILLDLESSQPWLLVSEVDKGLLDTDLPGWRAAAGPVVTLDEVGESLRWARRMISLVHQGVLPDKPVTWFDQHMSALWLFNDQFLVGELSRRVLSPLDSLTDTQRGKLSETLLTWLETRGSADEIAVILGVHPQTVRYRLRRLEKLFGTDMGGPGVRFDLEVALRVKRTLRSLGPS